MRSGALVDFTKENVYDIRLYDILYSLAYERRFFNQIPWTVLQHLLVCGSTAQELYGYNRLLVQHSFVHDFTEAFVRDVPAPFKTKDFREAETKIYKKLLENFNIKTLSNEDAELLHNIDLHVRYIEAFNLYDTVDCADAIYSQDLSNGNLDAKLLVVATTNFNYIRESHIFGDNGELLGEIVTSFERILSPY